MIFLLLLLIVLTCWGLEVSKPGEYYNGYLSKDNSNVVRGIFLTMVFVNHMMNYVSFNGRYDAPMINLRYFLGQSMVSMFLFYSGYGISQAIAAKGMTYIRSMPVKRFLITLINFDLAVLVYLVVDHFLAISYPTSQILYSFIAWNSIGNSNWYIFAMLFCYLVSWLCFLVFHKHPFIAAITITLCCVGYFLWLYRLFPTAGWWYNTIFCYPLGIWYSLLKDKFETFVQKTAIATLSWS